MATLRVYRSPGSVLFYFVVLGISTLSTFMIANNFKNKHYSNVISYGHLDIKWLGIRRQK